MHKKIISSIFLLFAILITGCSSEASFSNSNEETTNQVSAISEVDKIEIIDFHSSRRCYSCLVMEKLTKATLEEHFQSELRDGKITFSSINVEKAEHKNIVQKYQARGSSLFINVISDGKDNISEEIQVWRLLNNEQAFKQYLKNRIETLMKK